MRIYKIYQQILFLNSIKIYLNIKPVYVMSFYIGLLGLLKEMGVLSLGERINRRGSIRMRRYAVILK